MEAIEIYSDKITRGSRTYFFDIKESVQGDLYLKISESKNTATGFDHQNIVVFDENIEDFEAILIKTLSKLRTLKNKNTTSDKAYSIEKIRDTHKQAYLPWALEDDNKLELLFCEGTNVKELSAIFERNIGAINSRIKKLDLKNKYQ